MSWQVSQNKTYAERKSVYFLLAVCLFPWYESAQCFLGMENWRRPQSPSAQGISYFSKFVVTIRYMAAAIAAIISIVYFIHHMQLLV